MVLIFFWSFRKTVFEHRKYSEMGNRGCQPVVLSYIRVILDLSRPCALELRFTAVD